MLNVHSTTELHPWLLHFLKTGSCYVAHKHDPQDPPISASQILGFQVCTTPPGQVLDFNDVQFIYFFLWSLGILVSYLRNHCIIQGHKRDYIFL
jgi:hypothetical protein